MSDGDTWVCLQLAAIENQIIAFKPLQSLPVSRSRSHPAPTIAGVMYLVQMSRSESARLSIPILGGVGTGPKGYTLDEPSVTCA